MVNAMTWFSLQLQTFFVCMNDTIVPLPFRQQIVE
jgi:hypothetical protein